MLTAGHAKTWYTATAATEDFPCGGVLLRFFASELPGLAACKYGHLAPFLQFPFW
jgi:hypothetical protein